MKKSLNYYFLAILSLTSFLLKAQYPVNYIFTQDSLKGFNEEKVKEIASSKHLIDKEYKYYMYKAKREFVNHKFNIGHTGTMVWKTIQTASVQPACSNVDFETGTLAGWTHTSGSNSNSSTMAGCCPTPGGVASVINGIGTDPVASAISLVSPFGGNKIVKLNNTTLFDQSVQRISQTFYVTSSNAIFQIAYAGILETGGHDCFEQPFMNISVMDSSYTVLSCPKIIISAPDVSCSQPTVNTVGWNPVPSSSALFYHTWDVRTIDLSPYIGSFITIQITVGDCIYGGHYGYGYFDCRCSPLELNLNGQIFDATPQTPINLSTCGTITANINAPIGLNPYLWNGPAGSGISGATTQSIITTTPGTYTLNMNPPGNCQASGTTKYIILHATSNPTVTNITAQPTCTNSTGSGTVIVNGGTYPYAYNWLPSATTSSLATGLYSGTNYTVTVVDTFGCANSTILSINTFTDAPTYTISPLSTNLTCNTNSVTITANTFSNTTAVWTHTNTTSFVSSAPGGTYQCVLTNTISTCTATVPVTVTQNTTPPAASYSANCNGSTIFLDASSSSGIALGWLAPTLPNPSPVSNPGTSTAIGIYTLTATNLSSGCKTTYTLSTVVPTLSLTTLPASSSAITCVTKTIQATTSSSYPNTIITWYNGTSTSTVNPYPITSAGTYTTIVSAIGGCNTQSVITITTNTAANVSISTTSTIIPCSTNNLVLNASGGPYTYIWTPSTPTVTTSAYTVYNAGTYTVFALNTVNGCTATATQSVSQETISASFTADYYQGLMPLTVTFSNTSTNATSYNWNLGNSSTIYTTYNTSTTYNTQGTYPVILTATKGFCVDTAIRFIKVDLVSFLTVPNVFTPNGDGKNDVFTLDAINMGSISITVYDRWGLKVYDATESGNIFWDGRTHSGSSVSEGSYFYVIKATGLDDQKYDFKGTINVFR